MNKEIIEKEYRYGTSDIVLAKKYNLTLKEIRRIIKGEDPKTSKQTPKKSKENYCRYCNKTIKPKKKYCDDHKVKTKRVKTLNTYATYKARAHNSLSYYDNAK